MYVSAYIIDANNAEPLGKATVRVTDKTGKAIFEQDIANENGYFEIWAEDNEYLLISHVGYNSLLLSVHDANEIGVIAMEPGSSTLPPVVVTPKKNKALLMLAVPVIAFAISEATQGKNKIGQAQALVFSKILSDPVLKWVFIIALVGLGILAFSSLKKIFQFLGLAKKPETEALDKAAENPESFWNPNFWRSGGANVLIMKRADAEAYARTLYNAFGAFNDNEEQAIGVFKKMKTQSQASYVADVFFELYAEDLLKFLRGGVWPQDRLSDADVNEITEYVSKLPKYRL